MATKKKSTKKTVTKKKSRTIGLSCDAQMAAELEARAKSMGIPTGRYCRIIIERWLESGKKLEIIEGERS